MKRTKKIYDQILTRFGDGEYLKHICTGKDEYPDQATFQRWRQKDLDLAEQFMDPLIKNVSALLENSELLIEEAEDDDTLEVSVPVHQKLRETINCCRSGNLVYCFTDFAIPFKSEIGFANNKFSHQLTSILTHFLPSSPFETTATSFDGFYGVVAILNNWVEPGKVTQLFR